MSDAAASAPWWERLGPGSSIPAAIVLVDCEFAEVTGLDEAARRRRAQYAAGVEYVARRFGAAEPIAWADNRATLILGGAEPGSIAARAFAAARYLWQRGFVDLGIPVRIAVHVGRVVRGGEPGAFEGAALGLCSALLAVAPTRAIALSSEVALSLRSSGTCAHSIARTSRGSGGPLEPRRRRGCRTICSEPCGTTRDSLRSRATRSCSRLSR